MNLHLDSWIITTLIHKRALAPRLTPGSSFRPHPDKVSISSCAEQQGCEKKHEARKKHFLQGVCCREPSSEAPGSWADAPLRLVVPDKIRQVFQVQQLEDRGELPAWESTDSQWVCCLLLLLFPFILLLCLLRFSAVGDWREDQSDLQIPAKSILSCIS